VIEHIEQRVYAKSKLAVYKQRIKAYNIQHQHKQQNSAAATAAAVAVAAM
jgi:hypothetical protein